MPSPPSPSKHRVGKKARLDQFLHEGGWFESREQARRAIMAGEVRIGDRVADKPATPVAEGAEVRVAAPPKYVGRGGLKLEAALHGFGIDPSGWIGLDIGASTGGFTDCLLQHGAAKVYAYDVGHGQLHWKMRSDPRVVVREKFNARHLTRADLPEPPRITVIDVSFISLTRILEPLFPLLSPEAEGIALIKPQFELDRHLVGKGGIVTGEETRMRAVEKIRTFVGKSSGAQWIGVMPSPITGTDGNHEFLAHLRP